MYNMEVPRRPGQRPARLPPQRQPQSQAQPPQHSPINDTSSGSTTSSHRRQHSPYYLPHFVPPPPYLPYHYPLPLYPYPPPPPPLYPLPNQPPFIPRQMAQRPREAQRYQAKENQSPGIRLHDLLKFSQSLPLLWLVSHLPKQAQIRRSEVHHSPVESLGQSILSQPATDPPVHRMLIVSNDIVWEIPIEVRPSSFISIETALFAIYAAMHQPLTPNEWSAIEEPHIRRSAHWARCSRLAKGADSPLCFREEMTAIRRVDLLGDKVAFKGLVPLSSPGSGNGVEFLIQLGSTQAVDKRTRMRRGSF